MDDFSFRCLVPLRPTSPLPPCREARGAARKRKTLFCSLLLRFCTEPVATLFGWEAYLHPFGAALTLTNRPRGHPRSPNDSLSATPCTRNNMCLTVPLFSIVSRLCPAFFNRSHEICTSRAVLLEKTSTQPEKTSRYFTERVLGCSFSRSGSG